MCTFRNFLNNFFFSTASLVALTAAVTVAICGGTLPAYAFPAEKYAATSRLASGLWCKVRVKQTGMQFVSNATLREMGFSDPAKVNAYGFGGRMISEVLSENHPDDLPILPTVHTDKGIYFFGHNHIGWQPRQYPGHMTLEHVMQPYAEESWYFLSDIPEKAFEFPKNATGAPDLRAPAITSFTQPLLHEEDQWHPSSTGRTYLGEDIRAAAGKAFNFSLTDIAEPKGAVRFSVGANLSSSSTVTASVNGKALDIKDYSPLRPVNSGNFMSVASPEASVSGSFATDTKVEIKLSGAANAPMARLDFIELEYSRSLNIREGQLYFNTMATEPSTAFLSGAQSGTEVWDVTDHTAPLKPAAAMQSDGRLAVQVLPGYREYIAFTPGVGGYPLTEHKSVANQDIHSLPTPDLLIISPREYLVPSQKLAAHRAAHDSLKVAVLTPEDIYNEFSSGTPDVSAFRKLLKMWYDRGETDGGNIRYCLIMSRPTYDNKLLMEATKSAGAPRVPVWQSSAGLSDVTSYSSTDFIGMLADETDSHNQSRAKIHVAVGHLPVLSLQEAENAVNKIIKYEKADDPGTWRTRVLLIADDQDGATHLNQTEEQYTNFTKTAPGADLVYEKLYLDAFTLQPTATGNTYPDAKRKMLRLWDEGVSWINYIGHASVVGWGHEDLLNWTDINNFSNSRLPFLYAATCDFAHWENDNRCGAELLWGNPTAGIIATICPSRTVLMTPNGYMSSEIAKNAFLLDEEGNLPTIGDLMVRAKNGISISDDNKLRFILMGDPSMKLTLPAGNVAVTHLGTDTPQNQEVASQSEKRGKSAATISVSDEDTVLRARDRVTIAGEITRPDGTVDETFDGIVDIQLFDAETVVKTNGNGTSGRVSYYNDRNTRLYAGAARVAKGKWSTTATIPSEIANNFSPASLVLYAYTPKGAEAYGRYSDFYVYGLNTDAPEDLTGPEITLLSLNRADFTDGDLVHCNPVVFAEINDLSGINLSDVGIGHRITLTLDGRTSFDDVNTFYAPDPDDHTAGSIMYPLSDLEAGEHTLRLTVWDNANNSSTRDIKFNVAAVKQPEIFTLTTDVNPARENVNFILSTDRSKASVMCKIEVFNLNGGRMWSTELPTATDRMASVTVPWNLRDAGGNRLPRGIYLYRATITSDEGISVTKTKKLAVAAQ